MLLSPLCWVPSPFQDTPQCSFCGKQPEWPIRTFGHFCTCGAPYCSASCQSANRERHRPLCVGPLQNESHPLYRYKLLALEEEDSYPKLIMALELVCCHPASVVSDLLGQSGQEDYDEEVLLDEKMSTDSYLLACDILACQKAKTTVSWNQWKQLLFFLHRHIVTASIPSARADACRDLTVSHGWSGDDDKGSVLLAEANQRWKGHDDGPTVDVVQLMDEPGFYFPPLECSVLPVPFKDEQADRVTIEHSCIPSHEVVAVPGGENGMRIDLCKLSYDENAESLLNSKDDGTGEHAVTITLIDHEQDLDGRTESLLAIGIRSCDCIRCCFERNLCQSSRDTLAKLVSLAKAQHRYGDAIAIYDKLLETDETDSSAFFERARVAGWMGDFSLREQWLEEAQKVVSYDGKSPIHIALTEAKAYYRSGTDWSEPTSVANSTMGTSYSYTSVAGLENRAFVVNELLDATECSEMVRLAEEHQQSTGGWTTSRHYAVPTTDVPIFRMETVRNWFNKKLEQCIFPILKQQFNVAAEQRLRIFDAFFVKYDAATGQKRLPLHNDQSVYSLTIAMNPCSEYKGGGTYFAATGENVKTDVGGMISFQGELLHAGKSIETGRRYIIACFIYLEDC